MVLMQLVKTFEDFYRSKANTDGYDGRCKACDALQCVERRRKKQRIETPTVAEKVCHYCPPTPPPVHATPADLVGGDVDDGMFTTSGGTLAPCCCRPATSVTR